jgi:UDP-N-acetylmuramoylalanine--D-glutamate ligase
MHNREYYKGKRIAVIGFARSGLACANLLHYLGAKVSITDSKPKEALQVNLGQLASTEIHVECGGHSESLIRGSDMVVLSPGISDEAPPVQWAIKGRIPIYSEVEVAWSVCSAPVIAITGSNGKTTTTTLMGYVIAAAGKHAVVCGNIGNPFSGEVMRLTSEDIVVLEISSFQLEKIVTLKPYIAIITNINPNHLDRYPDMQAYVNAKKRIFLNQDSSDYLILNSEDAISRGFASEARGQIKYFGNDPGLNQNQSAVVQAAKILGISREVCVGVFSEFKGLEHRMEEVTRINGVIFVNDSKATTVESTMWALRNIPTSAVLIAGGKDKGLDYRWIRDLARQKLRGLVLIGQARHKIREALSDVVPVEEASDLGEAVMKAYSKAQPGDYVLLSPMCSSYDMFTDYEDRGRVFKRTVKDLEAHARITH